MTLLEAKDHLLQNLVQLYDNREAEQITHMVLEHITGMNRTERAIHKQQPLSSKQVEQFKHYNNELSAGRPVQYLLGEAWFAGLRFIVNEHTLIPRPETEELIEWIKAVAYPEPLSVLDIGTGSGCIPVTLKKNFPLWNIQALDLSDGALQTAKENATLHRAEVEYIQMDFLDEQLWPMLGQFDIIISNPPYIRDSESAAMSNHVLNHEPHIALFVPDDDAFIFYKKIAAFGKTHLKNKGQIFLEINQQFGNEVCTVFENAGYSTILRQDLHGNNRMVAAELSKAVHLLP
jgi:release factor glutamine methyltransferase